MSITTAEVSTWMGKLMASGLARSTVTRALATLRSLLAFAVADGRVTVNVAAIAKAPTGGQAGREGLMLTFSELEALATACRGPYGELVMVLGLEGLRWGEMAGLQVGDRVSVSGPGLRLSRTVLASNGGGALYLDSSKNRRARTVPLIAAVVPIVERWAAENRQASGEPVPGKRVYVGGHQHADVVVVPQRLDAQVRHQGEVPNTDPHALNRPPGAIHVPRIHASRKRRRRRGRRIDPDSSRLPRPCLALIRRSR